MSKMVRNRKIRNRNIESIGITRIGSLVTANIENRYRLTSEDSICEVVKIEDDEMRIRVIAHIDLPKHKILKCKYYSLELEYKVNKNLFAVLSHRKIRKSLIYYHPWSPPTTSLGCLMLELCGTNLKEFTEICTLNGFIGEHPSL